MKTIKTVGVATAVALALIAFVGVSSASASYFKVEVEPATWSGSLAGKNHLLNLGPEQFSCSKVAFSGETKTKAVSELTTAPELGECSWLGAYKYSWTMNGCKLRLRAAGSADITGCSKPMTFEGLGCRIEIGNQGGLGGITYKNVAGSPKTITAIASLSGITYTRSNSGSCGGGSAGTFHDGTYTGEWTMKGFTKPGGIQAGVEFEATAPPPPSVFAAEEAPVTISGATLNGGTVYFKTIGGNGTSCHSYSVKGSSATTTATSITLTPTYKECTVGGESVPDSNISMGGCSYVFHENGVFDIAGATCASSPITITRSGCVATIGPQSGIASEFTYVNEGYSRLRTIAVGGSTGSKIVYANTGPLCGSEGGSTGRISSAVTLTATNAGGEQQGLWIE